MLRARCIVHSDPDARKLALELNRKWMPPVPAAAGSAGGDAAPRPGSRTGGAPGGGALPPPSELAKQQQQAEEDVADYIDEVRAAELALLEQQAAAAAAAAAQLKAELEASQAAQLAVAAQEKQKFLSFKASRARCTSPRRSPDAFCSTLLPAMHKTQHHVARGIAARASGLMLAFPVLCQGAGLAAPGRVPGRAAELSVPTARQPTGSPLCAGLP